MAAYLALSQYEGHSALKAHFIEPFSAINTHYVTAPISKIQPHNYRAVCQTELGTFEQWESEMSDAS